MPTYTVHFNTPRNIDTVELDFPNTISIGDYIGYSPDIDVYENSSYEVIKIIHLSDGDSNIFANLMPVQKS